MKSTFTRRQFFRAGTLLGGALLGSAATVACAPVATNKPADVHHAGGMPEQAGVEPTTSAPMPDEYAGSTSGVRMVTFDRLFLRGADGSILPGLALAWRRIDALTWEFKLRQGTQLANRGQLNAAFVKTALSRSGSNISKFDFTSIHAPDARTVQVTTREATDDLIERLADFGDLTAPATVLPNGRVEPGSGLRRVVGINAGESFVIEYLSWDPNARFVPDTTIRPPAGSTAQKIIYMRPV